MTAMIGCQCYAPVPLRGVCLICGRPISWEASGRLLAAAIVRTVKPVTQTSDAREGDEA